MASLFHKNRREKKKEAPVEKPKGLTFWQDLKWRLEHVKASRWVRFSVVSLIFFLWVAWLGNLWVLFAWLLLLDIYILGYVPWGWWKNSKGITRVVMGWIDAILYALILVYFIFAFIGQNYQIPSSSLEKSLLVGDFLWVNKALYGPRVPMTPVHFPLSHNTLPIVNTKSYLDKPSLEYHRLKGLRSIERGDIVVFNYPQGDTVALKIQNPDYYMIIDELARNGVANPREYVRQHPETFGEIVWRPVDRRENYVKRAIGLPGDRLVIKNDTIYINGEAIAEPENVQYNYIIPVNGFIPESRWKDLHVRADDFGAGPISGPGIPFQFYNVPLTKEMKAQVEKWPEVVGPLMRESESGFYETGNVFPSGNNYGWRRPDMGEIWIPKKGSTLRLTKENLPIYERAIRVYEGNDLRIDSDGDIIINGKKTDLYTFKMDYYWMMGDNRDRSLDSRYWGFVPEDHVVGSPMFIIASFDSDRGWTEGKLRTDRILRSANPEKDKWK